MIVIIFFFFSFFRVGGAGIYFLCLLSFNLHGRLLKIKPLFFLDLIFSRFLLYNVDNIKKSKRCLA